MRDSIRVVRNALRLHDKSVVWHKLNEHLRARQRRSVRLRALDWCRSNAGVADAFAQSLDAELWSESLEYEAAARSHAKARLASLGVELGGGGHYPLLYFLVRHFRPKTVVETGVAAGYSSHAVLSALEINQRGILWSSDLPYLRLDDPERFIGYLVDDASLRSRWHLLTEGDNRNLQEIVRRCGPIDLISYDSDKSYRGRQTAMNRLLPQLRPGGMILMDDIQDNLYFRDLIERHRMPWWLFEFEGKYAGLVQLPS